MKKLLLILAVVTLFSCNSDDDAGNVKTDEFENIRTTLPQGKWKITKMVDSTSDHTSDFQSFSFTFNEDGTVTAKNDILTEPGTWAYQNSSNSGEELVLQFSEMEPFDELNDDWDIVSVSNVKIELSDISGGDGDTELLTFTKI